jgi:ribose 5-phosphate isomerase A
VPDYGDVDREREKQAAAEAAAVLVRDGMRVGLGSGTTTEDLLPALARRRLSIRCVAAAPHIEREARELGLIVDPFDSVDHLDIAIDGADKIADDGWLIKGGGAAHTREKIVAAAAGEFVVIADSTKCVPALAPPVPLELLRFGLPATMRHLGSVTIRDVPPSPDGGVIADYRGDVADPAALSAWLSSVPGVVAHGLFPPDMVTLVLIGRGETVEQRRFQPARG